MPSEKQRKKNLAGSYTIPTALADVIREEHKHEDAISSQELKQNLSKNDYQQRKFQRNIDLNLDNLKTYKETMEEREFEREEAHVRNLIKKKEEEKGITEIAITSEPTKRQRKRRWDVGPDQLLDQNANNEHVHLGIVQSTKKIKSDEDDISSSLTAEDRNIPIINGIPLTNEIIDKILPPGYVVVPPPEGFEQFDPSIGPDMTEITSNYYVPPSVDQASIQTKKLMEGQLTTEIPGVTGLSFIKQEDMKYFGKLMTANDEEDSSLEQKKEIRLMKLLLKIKNGTPGIRKKSLRQLTDNSRTFGPKVLFNQILPLLLEPNLDDHERHVLVKLVGRILFHLDDLVRPYTHKILMVVSPLLIDEDFTIRLEARDIISSLTRAAGLANMIANLRPDLDHVDEYVRNVTSRVFAIVANTLGLVNFIPFLKAVIKSKKNWMVRHTGIKIVQQLCILLGGGNGNSILPYLSQLMTVLKPGLTDEILQVRTMTALTLSQLAENVKPYGIGSFEEVLEPAWLGLRSHRGKGLASFLKCIGSIIPLMCHDPNYEEYANYYTKELMTVITREFNSPDEDMKITILKIMINLPLSRHLIKNYHKEIIKPFLRFFWNRRTASDSQQLSKLVVDATSQLAMKFDFLEILECIVIYTKDENESLRRMCVETINKMVSSNADYLIGLDSQLEIKLVDGILFAFQEQSVYHRVYLMVFDAVSKALNVRLKPHMNSIISTILYRLKNKTPEIRQQASDLITIIAPIIKKCSEGNDEVIMKLILILYESLGEIYPEVLGSILSALYACIDNVDKNSLYTMSNPSINQILPTLTPILKNRQDKVQESCIKLVGLIARKNSETINAKEWMRICFELLDMLKSPKKRIRIAANDTFGYIARTIGPQDVLAMLLNNLRVQERQLRVCTAVAIGIVAEICAPFTILPALMNEYRIPENNVQNGVLKALSFLFEYIDGNMTKDYLFAITPLLEDALTDRDQVHRQTAATVIRHMALNCVGLTNDDYYDVFIHYLNLLLPNVYETSPHVINRILESIEGIRAVIGMGSFSNYIWAGLFHPARKVRNPYWKIYNSAYVQHSDALVPYYPQLDKLQDDDTINYKIEELDLFI